MIKIITTVILEINPQEFYFIDQLANRVSEIVQKTIKKLHRLSKASFIISSLKLAHINIRSCRNKEMEISLFLKEKYTDILTLNETCLKVS